MKPKKIVKKIIKIPLKVIDQYVENQTGVDLSKIFSKAESGLVPGAELVVTLQDASQNCEIMWNPEGNVDSSQVTAIVQSILIGRPYVQSIVVVTQPESSPQLVLPLDPSSDLNSGGVVSIQYEDIEDEDATE